MDRNIVPASLLQVKIARLDAVLSGTRERKRAKTQVQVKVLVASCYRKNKNSHHYYTKK